MNRFCFRLAGIFLCMAFLVAGCASDQEKKEKLLAEGRAFFNKGEYNKAVIQLKNAIALDPGSAQAYELLAKTQLKLGDTQQGFNALLKLEQINPDNLDVVAQVASFFLLGRNVEEATIRVDRVLGTSPDHIPALFLKAGILSRDKANLDEVRSIYEKILQIDPKQSKAHQALARLHAAKGEFDKAENDIKNALALEPDNAWIYKTLFGFYISRNNPAAAEKTLADLIAKKPDDADPYLFLGKYHLGRDQLQKAKEAFTAALEKAPDNISPYMLLAKVVNRQGKPDEAESYILKALSIEPDNYAAKNAYAEFHFSRKDLARAEEIVTEILAKRPDFLPTKILKGKILAGKNDFQKAADIFRDLIKEEPESAMYRYLLGSVLYKKGDTAQAKSFLASAIEKNPRLLRARLLMGNIHYREGDLELAADAAERALSLAPGHYNANILMGNVLLAKGDMAGAEKIFRRLIKGVPDNPTAFYRMGILERSRNRFDRALEMFDSALAIDPGLMDVLSGMISVHVAQGQFETALEKCDESLRKNAGKPIAESIIQNLKGNVLLAGNRTSPAEKAFETAIEKNPRYMPPYLTLAKIIKSRDGIDDTISLYTRLIENRPDQASPHTLLGTLYEQAGKPDMAETHYKKALAIDRDYIPAVNNLAYLYAEQGKELNQALDLARRAKQALGGIPAVMDTLGWVYYQKELYDSAAMEFEACVEKTPDNPMFNYHLGLAYHKLNKPEEAANALKKALALKSDFTGADEARKILAGL